MTLELIVFVASILFGILLYWRESNGNGFYRFVNKLVNSRELQMKPSEKKGFIFQQPFLLRLVYITALFLVVSLVLQFLTSLKPFGSYNGISTFASCIVGTLIGTYVASFVIKSGDVIEEKSESLEDIVHDTIEKGKDFIEDITHKDKEDVTSSAVEKSQESKEQPKTNEKSARDRLKDKGYLK